MTVILGLMIAALVLVFFEIILPGGILGLLAVLCVIVAAWLGYAEYGVLVGSFVLLGSILSTSLLIFIEFKLLAQSKLGKGFFLGASVTGHSNQAQGDENFLGREATALTRLNPSGKVAIDGNPYEAYSEDGYIEAGEVVSVARRDNFKLIIKKP